MFIKYSVSTLILCSLLLGYLYMYGSPETEKQEINFQFSEDAKELSSGDASFVLNVENPGPEKNVVFTLKKELPEGWEANFCFNDLCFADMTEYTLKNGENVDIFITVTPDYDKNEEGDVKFLISGDGIEYEKTFYVKAIVPEKEYSYSVTGEKEMEIEASKTAEFTINIKNNGEKDSYSLILEKDLPEGWKASLSEDKFSLARNEAKTIRVYITSPLSVKGGEEGSISLRIIPENAEEKKITLKAIIKKDYDFQIRCLEPEKYAPKDYDVVFTLNIINTGNAKDSYHFETEYGTLSKEEVELNPKEKYALEVTLYSVQKDKTFTVRVRSGSGIEKEIELSVKTENLKKKVFGEIFTATWCTYCPIAEDALEEVKKEYGEKFFYIQYHPGDSMKKEISEMRLDYYGFGGYPTVYFNGIHEVTGGYKGVEDKYRGAIEEELQRDDEAIIDLDYRDGELTVHITPLKPSSEKYDLYIITYKDIQFKTKVYPNVAQDYIKKSITLNGEKSIKVSIKIEEGVVVFIQDREILDFETLELI